MDFNDVIYSSCDADAGFAHRLGFKHMFVLGKDIELRDVDRDKNTNASGCIVIGSNKQRLEAAVKSGALAIGITDHRIDRKLMQTMKEREVALLVSFAGIKELGGSSRQRALYLMAKLVQKATKMDIEVCFASMARSRLQMFSTMQLIEMAKLLGVEEADAKAGLSMEMK
ncbi:MAG TPA: hypothetical protein VND15_01120 [Candidatus Acidoferrales bacterium]|nr:hypothetical protein [Candidatus Acidoferrales bacterium]